MQTTYFGHKTKSTDPQYLGGLVQFQDFYFRDKMWSFQARQRIMEKDECGGEWEK